MFIEFHNLVEKKRYDYCYYFKVCLHCYEGGRTEEEKRMECIELVTVSLLLINLIFGTHGRRVPIASYDA